MTTLQWFQPPFHLQRFRRISDEDAEPAEAEWSGSDGEDSEDGGDDGQYKPIYAFWAEKGLVPPKNVRKVGAGKGPPGNTGRKRKTQVPITYPFIPHLLFVC